MNESCEKKAISSFQMAVIQNKRFSRRLAILLTLATLFSSCQYTPQTQNSQADSRLSATESLKVKRVGLADMKWFLDEIASQELDHCVADYGFHKRANGIYLSNEMVTAKKPKHWLKFMEMGEFSHVSFMTVDRHLWDALIAELAERASPKEFQEASNTKAERYQFDEYIVETYFPISGVDVALNSLYEILIQKRDGN